MGDQNGFAECSSQLTALARCQIAIGCAVRSSAVIISIRYQMMCIMC